MTDNKIPVPRKFTAVHTKEFPKFRYDCWIKSEDFFSKDDPRSFSSHPNLGPKFRLEMNFFNGPTGFLYLSEGEMVKVHKCEMVISEMGHGLEVHDMNLGPGQRIGGRFRLCPHTSRLEVGASIHVQVEVTYSSSLSQIRDSTMSDQMLGYLEEAADVIFFVGDETIKAHKMMLSARTTYFRNMFDSGMRESRTKEIHVPDAEPAVFKEFLKFVYSDSAPKNLDVIATKLFPLADLYGIQPLKEMCLLSIHNALSKDVVIKVLMLADLHNCQKLTDECIPIFKENLKFLKESDDWDSLQQNPALMAKLLGSFTDVQIYRCADCEDTKK